MGPWSSVRTHGARSRPGSTPPPRRRHGAGRRGRMPTGLLATGFSSRRPWSNSVPRPTSGPTSCSARCSRSAGPAAPRRPSPRPTTASSVVRSGIHPGPHPALQAVEHIDVGVLHINSESARRDPHVPFGGAKKSGWPQGAGGGAAREFFTHTTTVYCAAGRPAHERVGALDGIVVVDFSRVLAGPYATMMLGDFGAEVIKIERPGTGDDTRHWGPPYDSAGVATYFNSVNRKSTVGGARSADPGRSAAGPGTGGGADIVVENFPARHHGEAAPGLSGPGRPAPDLIYCSITGFGHGGGAALPATTCVVQAVGG